MDKAFALQELEFIEREFYFRWNGALLMGETIPSAQIGTS